MSGAQRTLEEICARYELEPDLVDVYVEGDFDQEVLSRAFEQTSSTAFYTIDTVFVPAELLEKHALTSGHKQRVIALAKELEKLRVNASYKCLVDTDLDGWLGTRASASNLYFTKHTCLELYFFDPNLLRELLVVLAGAQITDWDVLRASMTFCLAMRFALRISSMTLNLGLSWIDLSNHLSLDEDEVCFDRNEFAKRVLLKNGKGRYLNEFLKEAEAWQSRFTDDPRTFIRGHDLMCVLEWLIKRRGLKNFANQSALARVLILLAPRAPELAGIFL